MLTSHAGQSARDPMHVARPSTYGVGAWHKPVDRDLRAAAARTGLRRLKVWPRVPTTPGMSAWCRAPIAPANRHLPRATSSALAGPADARRTHLSRRDRRVPAATASCTGSVPASGRSMGKPDGSPSRHRRRTTRRSSGSSTPTARARTSGAERTRVAVGLEREWGPRAASYRPASSVRRGAPSHAAL
mgnify:CR=1 FL=1